MPLLASLFFGFAPMLLFAFFVYWIDRYEKEPRLLLMGVFLWGAIIAAGSAFVINTLFGLEFYFLSGSERFADLATGSLVAPAVEETLKGLAVLLVFLFLRREFDSVLDGMIYAAVVALGFAATENSVYIYRGFSDQGWAGFWTLVFIRVVLVGWQHPFYTAFIGIGLAIARLSRKPAVVLTVPLLGLALAIGAHTIHNTLPELLDGAGLVLSTGLDWMGWAVMALVALWAVWRESIILRTELQEEVNSGRMTPQQYRTAGSALARVAAAGSALFSGRYAKTVRFYQVTGELAHKKAQLARLGDEGRNAALIAQLRGELASLSPYAQA
jgi:RsiW-degrading membrane proteinase PrsW (M82 family)